MKTKEEVIKEAWVILMPDYTIIDLVNGWSLGIFNYKEIDFTLFDVISTKIGYFIRPKSLQGIENNNGWIKIESEKDLPNGYCDLHLCRLSPSAIDSEDYIFYLMKDFNKSVGLKLKRALEYTHYQPITKPQPPLY